MSKREKLTVLGLLVAIACVYWVLAWAALEVDARARIHGEHVTIFDVIGEWYGQ